MRKTFLIAILIAFIASESGAQVLDWVGQFGGANYVYASNVSIDAMGNVYSTGFFKGTADFDPGAGIANLTSTGTSDAYISKLDALGNYVWAKKISGSGSTIGSDIFIDASGSVVFTGRFEGTADLDPGVGITNLVSAGLFDIFVSKLDLNGNFIWAKRIGGTSTDWPNAIFVDSVGNIYTTGHFEGTADFDPGDNLANLTSAGFRDVFVSKLNSSGDYVWARNMGGSSTDFGNSITVDGSSNVYTTGFFQSTADFDPGAGTTNLASSGSNNVFISKLDASGNFVWAKQAEGINSVTGNGISIDASGNTYITGSFEQTMDFDPGVGIANLTSSGESDIFILKLNSSGNYIWAKNMGGTESDISRSISVDENGNAFTTGYFKGTADFDPAAGQANVTSAGSWDIFVCKLSSQGNYNWAVNLGGSADDFGESIVVDQNGDIFTTGYFQGTVDFDPGSGNLNITSTPSSLSDAFVHKMNSLPVGVVENSFDHDIRIFPNPTSENIRISIDQNNEFLFISVFDIRGRLIQRQSVGNDNIISIPMNFPSGLYLVEISSSDNKALFKVIKQ